MSKYITVQGDMFDSVAYKLYGDCRYTDNLMRKNMKHRDVYVFSDGIELDVPKIENDVKTVSVPPWK